MLTNSKSFDRFKKFEPNSSITNATESVEGTKDDQNKPYNLIEWIDKTGNDHGSPDQYLVSYNTYLKQWFSSKGIEDTNNNQTVIQTYRDLLKEVVLTYSTNEERRFLSNADLSNPHELDIVIPFFATRLKEIVTYLANKREEVKFQKVKNSLIGSVGGVEKLVYNSIFPSQVSSHHSM